MKILKFLGIQRTYQRSTDRNDLFLAQDLRIMGDLGALQFVQGFDMERWTDDQVFDVIRHSNVVYNVIGNFKSTNHWPREMTNVEWPERLAKLVAAKEDGTR